MATKEVKWEEKYYPKYPLTRGMQIYEGHPINFNCYNNALLCIKCGEVTPLDPCSNCGSDKYESGTATAGSVGLFCKSCNKGFTYWTCQKCGTENPVNNSIAERKTGCFIATAVYDSPFAEEVLVLKYFRDEVLARSILGRTFITGYYRFSPFYARLISQSETLKRVVRTTAIAPLFRVVESFLNRKG